MVQRATIQQIADALETNRDAAYSFVTFLVGVGLAKEDGRLPIKKGQKGIGPKIYVFDVVAITAFFANYQGRLTAIPDPMMLRAE